MDALITIARVAAPVLAFFNFLGLMFFADYYFAPEYKIELFIYGFPIPALIVGAFAPRKWLKSLPFGSLVILIELVATLVIGIALYRDITLINGADWPAAILRIILMAIAVLFSFSVFKERQRSAT